MSDTEEQQQEQSGNITTLFGAVFPRTEKKDEELSEQQALAKYRTPVGGKLTVKIQDTMRADAPAVDIASHEVTLEESSEWPQHFALKIDLDSLDERFDYSISARVETAEGKLWGINDVRTLAVKHGKQVQRNGEVGIEVELKVI